MSSPLFREGLTIKEVMELLAKEHGSHNKAAQGHGVPRANWYRIKDGKELPGRKTMEKLGIKPLYEWDLD